MSMAMTETTGPLTPASPAPRRIGLRLALAAVALIELGNMVTVLALINFDLSSLGAIVKLNFVGVPVLALTALAFALIGHFRHAITALGAIVLLTWLKYMSLIPDGFYYGNLLLNLDNASQAIIFPLLGIAASALAVRGERIWLATILVAIPTLVALFNALAFLIAVTIYGF